MLVLSTVAIATPAAVAQEQDGTQAVQTLADGEELYLVFGANLEDMTLEEYIETHALGEVDQETSADVIQYQDVDQVNINQQGNATSISIDNGTATAVQEANQRNSNSQVGEATAENRAGDVSNTLFEDVGTVYVVVGDSGQQFEGWGIADKKGDKAETVTQEAQATITQYQEVEQANVNQQNTAFAIAENESEATAIQQSYQYNENLQEGAANATNVYQTDGDGDGDGAKYKKAPDHYQMTYDWHAGEPASAVQLADATVEQAQEVDQANVNEQTAAVAIAVGENATATAVQFTEQSNLNAQLGTAEAINVLEATSGMNVATAGAAADEIVSQETETVGSHDKKKKSDGDGDGGAAQQSNAEVTQYQSAEQLNVNMQSSAIAIATNGSEATAVQLAYQQNYNAQVGYADAVTVGGSSHGGVVYTEETSVTLAGESSSDSLVTFDFAGENYQTNDVDQQANAQIEQAQFVAQENFNEQQGAVAVADGEGETASAVQLSMQENENLQYAAVGAVTVPATP